MRKVLIILFVFIYTLNFSNNFGFKYQSILRNDKGAPIINKKVSLKFSIIRIIKNQNQKVFIEEHTKLTNKFGLIVLTIGHGKNDKRYHER